MGAVIQGIMISLMYLNFFKKGRRYPFGILKHKLTVFVETSNLLLIFFWHRSFCSLAELAVMKSFTIFFYTDNKCDYKFISKKVSVIQCNILKKEFFMKGNQRTGNGE